MRAELLLDERHILGEDVFVELVVWRLPRAAKGSAHIFKYRLALVINGICVMRYDNEPGKGDHRHIGAAEEAYDFTTPEALLEDFWSEVERWTHK
ncbi:hypothetical protein FHS83_003724 [Rhizomicrobium palustre]|uniref:Uncharacterized protein n=1 Tax=Rhizomicrobium palustre TaxID=189966 RepID=A0A846N3U7_9PROT|nr:DUF6516 family protein [Rhizomicrobium palustre]NIK90406.1 hypothetical protein [Rhizomicrobium palustre]